MIVDRAHDEVIGNAANSYAALAQSLEELLSESPTRARKRSIVTWHSAAPVATVQQALARRRRHRLRRVFAVPRSAWVRGISAVRVAWKHPPLRRLGLIARGMHPRPTALSTGRVLADVLRLGLIRMAHTGEGVGAPFHVVGRVDSDGSLTLTSHPGSADESRRPVQLTGADVRNLREALWDHRSVAESVPYAFSRSRWINVAVGGQGIYELGTLPPLARTHPEAVAATLNDVLLAQRRRGRPLFVRFLWWPSRPRHPNAGRQTGRRPG